MRAPCISKRKSIARCADLRPAETVFSIPSGSLHAPEANLHGVADAGILIDCFRGDPN